MVGMQVEDNTLKAIRAQLRFVETLNTEFLDEAKNYEQLLIDLYGVKNLDAADPTNDVEDHKRKFATLIASITDAGYQNVRSMTLRDFFSTVYYLEEKARKQKAAMASRRR